MSVVALQDRALMDRSRAMKMAAAAGNDDDVQDRDSEPDYLLCPTTHGPGGTLLILSHSFFKAQVTEDSVGTEARLKEIAATTTF